MTTNEADAVASSSALDSTQKTDRELTISLTERSMENSTTIREDKFDDKDADLQRWAKLKDKNFMKNTFEKYVYVFNVINFGATLYAAGGHGGFLPWYYTIKAPIMIGTRFFVYKNKAWHWFLMDFCYFVNTALLVYLWIYPDTIFFSLVFSLCNGPLLFALIIFGNTLVFHSLDKTTSILIHLSPAICTYVIRWEDLEWWDIRGWKDSLCTNYSWINGCSDMQHMILYPFLFTIIHQILYGIVIQGIFKKRIMSNPKSLTSFRYLFPKDKQKGLYWKIINCLGKKLKVYVYSGIFIVWATLTYFLGMLCYRYQIIHTLYLLIAAVSVVKNGAEFYAKVYTMRPRKPKNSSNDKSKSGTIDNNQSSNESNDERTNNLNVNDDKVLQIRLEPTPEPPKID